jgi:mono/diheme cytochrome c family protein
MTERSMTRISGLDLAMAAALLGLCGGSSAAAHPSPDEGSSKGKSLISGKCVACHAQSVIDGRRASEAEWRRIVERMRVHGADLNEHDVELIVRYLRAMQAPA